MSSFLLQVTVIRSEIADKMNCSSSLSHLSLSYRSSFRRLRQTDCRLSRLNFRCELPIPLTANAQHIRKTTETGSRLPESACSSSSCVRRRRRGVCAFHSHFRPSHTHAHACRLPVRPVCWSVPWIVSHSFRLSHPLCPTAWVKVTSCQLPVTLCVAKNICVTAWSICVFEKKMWVWNIPHTALSHRLIREECVWWSRATKHDTAFPVFSDRV
jgi:hypothetical protein